MCDLRKLPMLLALLLSSCLPRESAKFAPPSFESVSAESEGREAVVLRCELSDPRVESCGFLYGTDDLEWQVECSLAGNSFEARLTDVVPGVVYSWCAYACAGTSEIRSGQGTFRLTADTDPIPIEDPAFKTYLVQRHDTDGDGEISYEEAEAVREVILYPSNEYNLQSLAGIEYMPNLERIDCHGDWYETTDKSTGIPREHYYVGPYKDTWDYAWGPIGTLKYVDVSNNPKLKELSIQNNSALGVEMGSINVSNCPLLTHIDAGFTWLEYPDVSTNTELDFIQFTHLRGTLPDFSRLTKVKFLFIEWPQDKQVDYVDLDVSGMPDLEVLFVGNRISSLSDLSANPKLRELYCWDNPISSGNLDMSGCPELEKLTLNNAGLRTLVLSNNTKLKELNCNWNQLTELDLSGNSQLEWLQCYDNNISSLDVSNCEKLRLIGCWDNELTSLDLRPCTELEYLNCSGNYLAVLDVSHNLHLGNSEGESGLWCVQRQDASGKNCLHTLYIAPEQQIPYVTSDRDASHIPAETEIVELTPYSLGDIVESDSPGIVAVVSDDGREVLLMSVDEIHNRPWQESWDWCEGHGAGWRMPTIDELDAIRPSFFFLNEKLRAAGYTPLTEENKCYWSCTPYEIAGYYYRERLWDGSIWYYGSDEWYECHANYTRAVKTISF